MKNLIYGIVFIIIMPIMTMGQNTLHMKEELFYGIKLYIIPNKQIKAYILKNKGQIDVEFSKFNRVPTYVFPNKNYLYDFNAHAFLFTSKDDLLKFKKISSELADDELKSQQISNLNEKFIGNVDSLIIDFEKAYQISFDFNKLNELRKLDNLINNEKDKNIFRTKWKNNIVAIVGRFLIGQLHLANWAINKVNGVSFLLIIDEKMNFYNPIMIVDKEMNYYLPEDGSVGFYDHAQIELIQYQVINKLTN